MTDKGKSKYPKSDQLRALREQAHEERVASNKRLIDRKVKSIGRVATAKSKRR